MFIYIICDYNNYTIENQIVFSSKKKALNFINNDSVNGYGDLLKYPYINWIIPNYYAEIHANKNDCLEHNDPIAVLHRKELQ